MPNTTGYVIEDMSLGLNASFTKTITAADIDKFAEISGDTNPVHLDADYAAASPFGERIAHGILTASHISAVLGTLLPGPGSIYMSQSLRFKAPVKINDSVTTTLTVSAINIEKKRVTLSCVCKVNDTLVLEGEAMVMVPSRTN